MNQQLLRIAQRIQALAHTGLHYGTGAFDRERYDELNRISLEIFSLLSHEPIEKIGELFSLEPAYATPKVDVRAWVMEGQQLLLVKEATDGRWSLPGGWADVGYSPKEVAEKEVWEESGLEVKAERLLAVFDKKCHPHPPYAEYTYKLCLECKVVGGRLSNSLETLDAQFFEKSRIPTLSEERITASQIHLLWDRVDNPNVPVWID